MIYWGHVCVWACYTNSSSFLPYTFTSTKHIDSTSFLEVCIFLFFFFFFGFTNLSHISKHDVREKAKNLKGVVVWFYEVYTDFMKFIQLSKILREMHGDQLQCYYGDDKPWNGKKKKNILTTDFFKGSFPRAWKLYLKCSQHFKTLLKLCSQV